jgi:dynein light chain LC8-type
MSSSSLISKPGSSTSRAGASVASVAANGPKKDDISVGNLKILYVDSSKEMEEFIINSSTNALKALYKGEKNHFTEVAQQIKKEIEETQEGGAWHVIVGKSFGSFVTHESKK